MLCVALTLNSSQLSNTWESRNAVKSCHHDVQLSLYGKVPELLWVPLLYVPGAVKDFETQRLHELQALQLSTSKSMVKSSRWERGTVPKCQSLVLVAVPHHLIQSPAFKTTVWSVGQSKSRRLPPVGTVGGSAKRKIAAQTWMGKTSTLRFEL